MHGDGLTGNRCAGPVGNQLNYPHTLSLRGLIFSVTGGVWRRLELLWTLGQVGISRAEQERFTATKWSAAACSGREQHSTQRQQ